MRYVLLLGLCLFASLSNAQGQDDFRLNPVALQKALDNCPKVSPQGMTCEQLSVIASNVNRLVSELRMDPQAFGHTILVLQQKIAALDILLKNDPSKPELIEALKADKSQLASRMAVVKWLESPESKN